MEQRVRDSFFINIVFCFLILFLFSRSAVAYKNYTVGDSLGWYDSQEKPTVNYQKWASGKTFSLGDFLSKYFIICSRSSLTNYIFYQTNGNLLIVVRHFCGSVSSCDFSLFSFLFRKLLLIISLPCCLYKLMEI